jgi:hypothetical protein
VRKRQAFVTQVRIFPAGKSGLFARGQQVSEYSVMATVPTRLLPRLLIPGDVGAMARALTIQARIGFEWRCKP